MPFSFLSLHALIWNEHTGTVPTVSVIRMGRES